MDENEEAGPVRRTRSAKAAKTSPVVKPVIRHKPGPLSRRTRKKVVLMEVEVSDDEDETPQENKPELDAAEEEKKVEEKLLESPDESNDSVDQKNVSAAKGKGSKANKGDDEKHELNGNGQSSESAKLDDTVTVVFNDVEMLEEAEGEINTDENDASKDSKVAEEKMEVDDEELVEKPSLKTVEKESKKEIAKKDQAETSKEPKTADLSKKDEAKPELSTKEKSKVEKPKSDESKTETSKQDEAKSECSKKKSEKEPETEVTKKESKAETPKKHETEPPKKDEPTKETLKKVAEPKITETVKSDKPNTEAPKKDEPKKETLKIVAEAEKSEAAQSDKLKIDTPEKDEPKKEISKKVAEVEAVQSVKPKTDTPKNDEPKKETLKKVAEAEKPEAAQSAKEVEVITEKPKKAEKKKDSDEEKSSKASEIVELKTDSTKKVEPKLTTPDKVKPKTTTDEVKPETTSEKVKPKTSTDEVKPETTSEKVKPETTSEKVKPESTAGNERKQEISEEPSKSKNLEPEKPLAEVDDQKKSKPGVLANEKPKAEKVPEIQKSEPLKEEKVKEIKEEIKKEDTAEKISELKVEETASGKGKEEKVLVTEVTKMEVDETPAEKTLTEEKASANDKLGEKKEDDVANTTKEAEKTKPEDQEPKEEVKKEKPDDSKQKGDPDAENISEDELPSIQAAKVPEAEEVSDEELPGPKRAELPADTEVVSEDELPTVKNEGKKEGVKRKLDATDYDPGSPTSENEAPSKKPALETSAEKDKEEKPAKAKKLPELDKYWKAVNDDPTDFTGWTYLLQYVDQENDMEAAREAYDAFLSHYPYCYGYWRKYADYEKRKGNKKKCEEVFERGLKAIPLSVDLWIHYLTYVKSTRADDEEFIRSQFERSILACGLEFRSDRLWDSFIKWETEGKRLQRVTAIYDRLLTTPTQGYTSHFDNFQEHIASNPPNKVIEVDEFLALRKEVKHMLKHDVTTDTPADDGDAPPGDDDPSKIVSSDEETKSIRERIVSIRRKLHKATVNAVTARWNYEEGIKRPYFHVKPLERCQLKNWQDYLDYETEQGDRVRIIVLFERCLIACALYEEFWLKFVHYLEGLKDKEMQTKIRDVYERACTIHHLKKPGLHLQWAMFEEESDNANRAAEILVNLEKSVPNILQIAYRRINLERRRKDHEKCCQLYEHYINNSKNKMISSNIAIKYSRFCFRVMKDITKAQEVLKTAITKDPNNPRLYLQLIDLALQKENVSQAEVIEVIDSFLDKDSTEIEQKVLFAQRKLEYVEDFGCDVQSVQLAYDQYQKILKQGKDSIKKKEIKSEAATSSKKEKPTTQSSSQSSTYNYGAYGNSSAAQPPSYPYSGSQQQGQNYYQQYGQGGDQQYQYQNWQYPQGGYGGYNQWGGYSGGYGY